MLLERDDVVAQLELLADQAAAGRGGVAFVVGEAGIGKTSVLRAMADRLSARLRPLWAACEDLSTAEALTLLRDLPIVAGEALDRANDNGSRLGLFAEVLAALAETPTVLLIEDLHWADDGSIDFIRYVGRRIEALPLLLLVSSRNEDQSARGKLARAFNDLSPGLRRRFDLDRLSSVATGRLAASQGFIGSAIHEITGGNPLLIAEILAAGGKRSASIDDLVVGRADRLDAAARAFLDYCAIIPRRVSLDQIVAAGGADAAIEACIEAALLQADGEGLAFRHEITRHAVADAMSPLRRALLHRRELDRLDANGGSWARRLHHAIGADDRSRVAELAPLAARQASKLGAHREAAAAWAALLENAPPPLDPQQCEAYAFELHVIGEIGRAVEWQKRVLAIHADREDRLRQGDALRFLSRLYYLDGKRRLADEAGAQAIPLLADFPDTPELALGYANLAHLAMLADIADDAVRWSEQAIPIAERLGRDDILATVLNNYGTAIQYEEPDRAFAYLDRSIALGLASGSGEHVARAYTNKSWALMQARRLAEALAIQREGVDYCRERDLETWIDYMLGGQALTLLELGQWDEADEAAHTVTELRANTHLMRNPAVRASALLHIRRGGGDPEPFIADLREHMANGREASRFTGLALIEAEQAWTRGLDPAEALSLLDEAATLAQARGCSWDRGALWLWQARLGRSAAAPRNIAAPYERIAAGDLDAAAAVFRDHAMPFDEAMILASGDTDQVSAGLAILDRLGAAATADRVKAGLAERGLKRLRGPRASTRANGFGLTRREIDVLVAVDKGWTNKEIGERLFVSAKTVDHHVSAILGKLGGRTRGEAAAIARAHGLIE